MKTCSPRSGIAAMTFCAAALSGITCRGSCSGWRGWSTLPSADNSLRFRPAASPRRVAVNNRNRTRRPNGPLSCSAATQTALNSASVGFARARAPQWMPPTATCNQRRHVIAAAGVPRQQGPQRAQHPITANLAALVGDLIKHSGELAARDPRRPATVPAGCR